MRSSVFVAFLLTSAALLAGCSGNGDDHKEHTYTCPNGTTINLESYTDHDAETFSPAAKCPKGTGSATNTTSQAPNQLPNLVLKVTDGTNETKVTVRNGNLTFDASGSSDPDGQITGIAVTVKDSNTTRTSTLYDASKKQFKPATFRFDRPGVVNVTVAMVDDRAGFALNQTNVYVNEVHVTQSQQIQAPNPDPSDTTNDACKGFDPLLDAQYYKPFDFPVLPGATWIEVTAVDTALLTICDPAGTPISDPPKSAPPVQTTPGVVLAPPTGIESYFVAAYLAPGPNFQVQVQPIVTIHYEPDTRGAA